MVKVKTCLITIVACFWPQLKIRPLFSFSPSRHLSCSTGRKRGNQLDLNWYLPSKTDDTLSVDLEGGRTIAVPIGWYPRLAHSTPLERANVQISGAAQATRNRPPNKYIRYISNLRSLALIRLARRILFQADEVRIHRLEQFRPVALEQAPPQTLGDIDRHIAGKQMVEQW